MRKNIAFQVLAHILLVALILFTLLASYKRLYNSNNINSSYGDKITYTASFKRNGATTIDKVKLTCTVINNHCLITLPKATRDNGIVLGYSLNKDSKIALYQVGQTINLTKDITLYTVSYQKLSLIIDSSQIDYISDKDPSCHLYNNETSCDVKIPIFNKLGYETRGYSTNRNSYTGYIFPNSTYTLTKNTKLYPIYNNLTSLKTINVTKNHMINNTIFDIETGCSNDIYNDYLEYFYRINKKAPYLMTGGKITFLTDKTFNEIWGESYVGMNYGPQGLRLIDIRCSNIFTNNYYATVVHELAHTWDFYYGNMMGKDISETNEIINLYNKYRNDYSRPFRNYSYTNIREFVADMIRYYYLKYIDPINEYKSLYYPNDIKQILEKLICTANNNYKNNGC